MTIDFDSLNVFQKFPSFIPWFNTDKGIYAIIVQPAIEKKKKATSNDEFLKNAAADALMEYYLPEFYPFIYNKEKEAVRTKVSTRGKKATKIKASKRAKQTAARARSTGASTSGVKSSYKTIRKAILDNLHYIKSDQGPADNKSAAPIAPKYLYNTAPGTINFRRIREGLRTYDPEAQARAQAATAALKGSEVAEACLLPGEMPPVPSYSSGFPSYEEARQAFLNQHFKARDLRPGPEAQILLGITGRTMRNLSEALEAYHQQIIRYPCPLKIPLDLEAINAEIRRVVSSLVANVRRDLNLSGKAPYLGPDDILRIRMNQNHKILGASYELETSDGLEVAPLKIGLFSLIKYNRSVKDPWLMQTLINHKRIIRAFNANSATGPGLPSLLNFIQDTYGELVRTAKPVQPVKLEPDRDPAAGPPDSLEVSFTAPPPPGVDPALFNSIFQASESSMTLDVSNPTSLATTLSTFLRSEEMAALEVALDDPDTQAALMLENSSKALEAKFPIRKVIDDIKDMIAEAKGINTALEERADLEEAVTDAETALSDAQLEGDGLAIEDAERDLDRAEADLTRDRTSPREGGGAKQVRDTLEIMDEVLARFGILELIEEALICLTMGSNFSLSRIRDAIDQGLEIAEMIEDYEPPKIPVSLLKIPEFPEIRIPNIFGDPPLWQQILNMLLEILMELAMDLIEGLVDMIKLNCNNMLDRPELLGTLDAAQAVKDNLPINNPNMEDLLDNAFGQFHLDQERGFAYLSAVSAVLTPMEICRLFNSRPDVQESTLEKIAIFNTTWPEETIAILQSRNQILSFFAALSPLTNMVTICNELVNDQDLRAAVDNYCLNEADFSTLADQESIKKLASLLNDGLPIDPASLLPNLLCPEHPQYLANPVIDRIIPSIFNTTVDNVKMQFVYSVEASRTSMLEPKVVAGVGNGAGSNRAVNEALKDLCVRGKVGPDCVEPPEVNTKFLSILADIFEAIQDVGLNIDPELCPDVNLDKLGDIIDPAILAILNEILTGALEMGGAAQQAVADASLQIAEIKDTMDDSGGGPPSVTYVFSRRFYNNFMAMARQSPPEYVDTNGNDKPDDVWLMRTESPGGQRTFYSHVKQDRSNDEYGRLRMQYRFLKQVRPRIDPLNLEFYSNEDIMSGRPPFRVRIPPGLVPGVEHAWLEGIVEDDSFTPLYGSDKSPEGTLGDFGSESGFNPYIFNFTYPLQQQLIGLADNPLSAANKRYLQDKLQKQVFPTVLNGMIKRTFGYVQNNGIFSLADLNKLNLFKDNTNCDPAQAGDLLDILGILEQIKQEFGEAACSDEGDAKALAKDALKLGLIYLFIQVYIVEFLIKNIFVIAAFKFEEVFQKPLFRELFLTSMVNQIEKKLARSVGGLERFLFAWLEKKLQRTKYQEAGGITHSYAPNTVVSFLKTGTDIEEVPFKKIVEYMIEERMGFTYEVCGQMINTVQTMNNILSPAGAERNFEDIFIKDILGIYKSPYGRGGAAMKSGEGRVFFAKYAYWDGISNWGSLGSSEILVPWDPKELLAAQSVWDTGFATAPLDYVTAGSYGTGFYTAQTWYEGRVGERPSADVPRHVLSLQEILGSAQGGAMPVRTGTAVDFLDMLEITEGTLPVFENLKVGYKLMFNFPHYRGAEYKENDWDQSDSPFVQSFRPGPVRDLMIKAMKLQGRAVGKDSILDSAQVDLDSSNPGAQILGDLLTVDIYSMGDFNPNNLEATSRTGELADDILQKVKRFNRTTAANHIPRIKEDEEYSRFISQTFNPEMIMMIPILYNLGLTNTFFSKIEENFDTTKYVILDLFGMLSRTNRAPPIASPETSNAMALANSLGSAGESDLGASAREFILKMLRETPIKILKGLAELIDPHVAIWKIVRDITGQVFSYIIDIIDTGIDVAAAVQPDGSPLKPILKKVDGEQLLALAFCGLNTMNADATAELPGRLRGDEAPSLGPKMTVRGVDFTGTIVGLFCMPPSPLGIIYLLLMLLEEGDDDQADSDGTGNSQQNAADGQSSNVC